MRESVKQTIIYDREVCICPICNAKHNKKIKQTRETEDKNEREVMEKAEEAGADTNERGDVMYNEKYAYNQDEKNFIGGVIKHNKEVKEAFRKAAQGEVIDLTALMISKEKLIEARQSFK